MAILFCKAQKTTCHACEELRTGVQKKIEVLYVDDACLFLGSPVARCAKHAG
jgi:hypothetical protein